MFKLISMTFFNDINTFGNIKILLYYIDMIMEGVKLRTQMGSPHPPNNLFTK